MSNPSILEVARPQDFARIVEIVNAAYRGTNGPAGWTNEIELLSGHRLDLTSLTKTAANPATVLLALKEGECLLGSVTLRDLGKGIWYLSALAVDPAIQTKGLGKAIMQEAEDFARRHSGVAIELSVVAQRESLIAWYERRGYIRTGKSEPFPYGDPSVGTPLRDDLSLVVLVKQLNCTT